MYAMIYLPYVIQRIIYFYQQAVSMCMYIEIQIILLPCNENIYYSLNVRTEPD